MFATLLIPLVALTLAPPDTVRVGNPSLPTALSPGVETVNNYVVRDGNKHLVLTFVQTITEVPDGYRIIQENRRLNGAVVSLDTIIVVRGTLATAWHGDMTPLGKRHVAFGHGRMTGVALDTLDRQTQIDVEVPSGLFDYSIMTLVADRLPLKVGYKATVATYDITRGEVYVPIEVVGMESIVIDGTTFDTWKMEVDLGGPKVSRWVERDTRKEIKWSVKFNGREMIGERQQEANETRD